MQQAFSIFGSLIMGLAVLCPSCTKDQGPMQSISECDTISSKYSAVILPAMQTYCAISGCHDGSSAPGNFNVYEEIKIVADNGKLRDRVLDQKSMPPSGSNPLPDSLLKKLNCWLNKGARNN